MFGNFTNQNNCGTISLRYAVTTSGKDYNLDLIGKESGGGDLFEILKETERIAGDSIFENDEDLSEFVKTINEKFGAKE